MKLTNSHKNMLREGGTVRGKYTRGAASLIKAGYATGETVWEVHRRPNGNHVDRRQIENLRATSLGRRVLEKGE